MSRKKDDKGDIRDVVEKFRTSKKESEELKEFSMLSRMSKSDFIRDAIAMKKRAIREKLGLREPEYEEYYEDYGVHEDDDDEESVENWQNSVATNSC